MSEFIYHQHPHDSIGMPLWSCRRLDSGIVGFGVSMEAAREDFETKENTLLPYPALIVEESVDDALDQGEGK